MTPLNSTDSKVSNVSWWDDVLVYRSSIIPVVLRPVLFFTLFSAGVATAAIVYGRQISLTNNVGESLSSTVVAEPSATALCRCWSPAGVPQLVRVRALC